MSDSRRLHHSLTRLAILVCTAVVILLNVRVSADDYSAGWGPAVGTQLPAIAAPDQAGVERRLAELSGDQGLLLFLSRSADW